MANVAHQSELRSVMGRFFFYLLIFAIIVTSACSAESDGVMNNSFTTLGRRVQGWQGSADLLANIATPQSLVQANFAPDSGVYTIQFGVQYPASAIGLPGPAPRTTAIINWKVEGNLVTRMIDVGNGTTISGAGEAVDVQVFDNSAGGNIAISATPYTVTAQISPGVRPASALPPTLAALSGIGTQISVVNAGGPVYVNVPQNAGVVSVETALTGGSAAHPAQIGTVGLPVTNPTKAWLLFSTSSTGFVAIPPGTRQIQITNTDPVNALGAFVTFGIDG